MDRELVLAVALVAAIAGACGEATPTSPVLAERHIEWHNAGDVENFLAAFADDASIMEIGTADDPEVVEAAEFQLGLMRGGEGSSARAHRGATMGPGARVRSMIECSLRPGCGEISR